jgi:hypothetical protein
MGAKKGTLGLALVATLALTITATLGAAGSSADPVAQTAGLKKCLKKAKKIQDPVKRKKAKKKCRKKFGTTTAPVSVVRATLDWFNGGSNDVDMDLFVFDSSGNRAGNGADAIPQSSLSQDVQGPSGKETFTDANANLHRPLSFGVCYTVGGSVHTDYTITYITSDGASHTDTRAGDNSLGSSFHVDYPADGVAIPSGYCPA